ncbi:hypothetical protein AB0M54_44420 [Actinoplanes sp. NPDC051470]|uniref:hypothetical protein n=1 Tax=unclassified Actinoplanes TaxID=2626549 RepID=UPI003429BBC7
MASEDGAVRIWDLTSERLMTELNLEASITELALAPGGLLCVGTDSGLVAVVLEP